MVDVLEFIDSKEIRAYNRETKFTPIEQAVLIYYSRKRTVSEKVEAWRELLETYDDEAFEFTRFGKRRFSEEGNRKLVSDAVAVCENSLAQRERTEGVVFEAVLYESEFPNTKRPSYFPNYNAAAAHIQECKQKYLDDDDLRSVLTEAKISIKDFGTCAHDDTVFYFDNELQMIDISGGRPTLVSDCYMFDDVFVYIPLPFKKGDILRSIASGEVRYGILPETPNETYFARAIDRGDGSDMIISIDMYEPDGQMGYFTYGHYDPLSLEKCPDDELPEELSLLLLVRKVHSGKLTFNELLRWYSNSGKEAYQKLYGRKSIKQTD